MTSAYKEFEKRIMAKMRKVYTEEVVDHAWNPRNMGRIEEADGFAEVTGSCGDTMAITLRVRNEVVTDAKFSTNGCDATRACGSMATELVKGKSLAEALKIEWEQIFKALGGLPESHIHCTILASETLKSAIMCAIEKGGEHRWERAEEELKKRWEAEQEEIRKLLISMEESEDADPQEE